MNVGDTLGGGRFVIERKVPGSAFFTRYTGRESSTGRLVHATDVVSSSRTVDELRNLLSYDVPGVAKCLFVGGVDGDSRGSRRVVVVESLPDGIALSGVGRRLTDVESLRIARDVARMIATAPQRKVILGGIMPDLVYVRLDAPVTVGLVPRTPMLASTLNAKVMTESFALPDLKHRALFMDPMMLDVMSATTATDVYCWGLLTAWMFEGKHPFTAAALDSEDWLGPMERDERDPFLGPPAIGRILDRVLLADSPQRVHADELVRELDAVRI